MEKLEMKYLAPYLPYKLRLLEDDIINGYEEYNTEMIGLHNDGVRTSINSIEEWTSIEFVKPILKPLIDLTRETLSKYYTQLMDSDLDRTVIDTLNYPLNQSYTYTTNFLLKNHYDIFGLIEKGLAINLNDL